jgi:uncharacterized protein (DUF1499 family)
VIQRWFRPLRLGLTDGGLHDCPESPNCVCSTASRPAQRIEPLRFDGDPDAALARLAQWLAAQPRTQIITRTDRYLHATCTSRIFRFVDDLEALVDPAAGLIQLRSASRIGYSDLGVNRRRIEALRQAWDANRATNP